MSLILSRDDYRAKTFLCTTSGEVPTHQFSAIRMQTACFAYGKMFFRGAGSSNNDRTRCDREKSPKEK